MSSLRVLVLALAIWASGVGVALPFNEPAHRLINETSALRSLEVDRYLAEDLRLNRGPSDRGLIYIAGGKRLFHWIGVGGMLEDGKIAISSRPFRHFHTPLRPWSSSGLFNFESAPRWAQAPLGQQGGSWWDARQAFWLALKEPASAAREDHLGEAFLALGQVMHLIADMAQPAHTRKDTHLFAQIPGGLIADFETFVTEQAVAERNTAERFGGTLLAPTEDNVAVIPIGRLWDTGNYTGSNPNVTLSSDIGLAEYSSANFFSEDTIPECSGPDGDLPHPRGDSLQAGPVVNDRQYLRKFKDGVVIEHMVAEGLFFRFTTGVCTQTLDDVVYSDYADLLIPKAIGYGQDLLEYFFRGRLTMYFHPDDPDQYVIQNLRPNENMDGFFALYYDDESGGRHFVKGWDTNGNVLVPGGQLVVTFDFPTDPEPAEHGQFLLVFRGELGLEPDAVTATWVDLRPDGPDGGGQSVEGSKIVGFGPGTCGKESCWTCDEGIERAQDENGAWVIHVTRSGGIQQKCDERCAADEVLGNVDWGATFTPAGTTSTCINGTLYQSDACNPGTENAVSYGNTAMDTTEATKTFGKANVSHSKPTLRLGWGFFDAFPPRSAISEGVHMSDPFIRPTVTTSTTVQSECPTVFNQAPLHSLDN